ncbi:hypothetical protein Dimus_023168 [Dionaea muscipula]
MNYFDAQKNTALVGCEKMGRSVVPFDRKSPVVCPKPRRVGCLVNNPTMSLRKHRRSLQELCDSKAGADILDMILVKEANGATSPPYFCGSPPTRVSNPLVLDARFVDGKAPPQSPLVYPSPTSPTLSPSARKGGCARMKFGLKPATVRVEGFDCLSRDRQNSSITAVA